MSTTSPDMQHTEPNLTPQSCPRVGNGFRLQWETVQNAHVLLYPEGMVKLNGSAGEILSLCDGMRTVEQIVALLEAKFSQQNLTNDVHSFLAMARRQGWARW